MRKIVAGVLAASVLSGCGGSTPASPEDVVLAWSAALNAGDNEAAASLFAPEARVVQGSLLILHGNRAAVEWNSRLPCSGAIVSFLRVSDEVVDATFLLDDRKGSACDGAGEKVTVVFSVRGGKIEVFHQLLSPPPYVPA